MPQMSRNEGGRGSGDGGGGDGFALRQTPLEQMPPQHSLEILHGSESGWQAQVVTPATVVTCFWQQCRHESDRALRCRGCPRNFLLGHRLPVGMQASTW